MKAIKKFKKIITQKYKFKKTITQHNECKIKGNNNIVNQENSYNNKKNNKK